MKERKHVSEEERKKGLIIFVLIGILLAITLIIIIMIIPKGKNEPQAPTIQPQTSSTGQVVQKEQTGNTNSQAKNTTSNKNSNSTENSSDLDIIVKDKNKVTMSIKTGTLTVDGAVIVITDTNISPYSWTPQYKLQQKVDDNWQDMELKNPENAFFAEIERNNDTGIMEQSLVWSNKYGSLGIGEYRIVKEAGGNEFYATFEVQ